MNEPDRELAEANHALRGCSLRSAKSWASRRGLKVRVIERDGCPACGRNAHPEPGVIDVVMTDGHIEEVVLIG